MQQHHLTLRLTRTQGSFDMMEDRTIRVDLPLDATEEDLRRAFHHVDTLVAIEGQAFLDAAVELVTSIIESREAIEQNVTNERNTATVGDHPLDTARSMDEQRTERAAKQATVTPPSAEPVLGAERGQTTSP